MEATGHRPRATGYRKQLDCTCCDKAGMGRDYRKLRVFHAADALVLDVYRTTRLFSTDERFGLKSQLRRAAVSVPTNIVEGCARATSKSYQHFVIIALGSACEARYLIGLSERLGEMEPAESRPLIGRYSDLIRGLQALIKGLGSTPCGPWP